MNNALPEGFSVIIPTFREALNLPRLIKLISQINFNYRPYEVIIVDDNSDDGTQQIVTDLMRDYPWLKLIIRKLNKGLSAAVLEGLTHCQYAHCVIMDADLSHPPHKIPELLNALATPNVDLVIGSRYVENGDYEKSWPLSRLILSRIMAHMIRILISVPVKDPLSGFFAVNKTIFNNRQIEPLGWKIALEIMIKCHCKGIYEVPIKFCKRAQGKSKLNLMVVLTCIRHFFKLLKYKYWAKKIQERT